MSATPGPWAVGAQNDRLFVTSGEPPAPSNDYPRHFAGRHVVAKIYQDGDFKSSLANARLIASAPDLLEAAKAVNHSAVSMNGAHDFSGGFLIDWPSLQKLMAAIAKAEAST